MKRLNFLVLLFVGLFFLSAYKINIKEKAPQDSIIGIWETIRVRYNFPDETYKEDRLFRCYDRTRSIYHADGTLEYVSPSIDNNTGECNFDVESYWKGTWKKIDDNRYSTKKLKNQYADTTEVYLFFNKGKTLKILRNYKEAGIAFGSSDAPVSEFVTLNRIE
jgi:hypothetical protein